MLSLRSRALPSFRRLCKAELGIINDIRLDPSRVTRYLGPIPDIIAAVRRGPAHAMVTIEAVGHPVGFYVVHPDPRDSACWWLGWLAVDCRQEGLGYGRAAVLAAIAQMARIPGCRRIRLLVAPDNTRALSLYARAGFRVAGCSPDTGEIVLEFAPPSSFDAADLAAFNLQAVAARARRVFRHRRLRLTVGPHAAWVIGVERGPPIRGSFGLVTASLIPH